MRTDIDLGYRPRVWQAQVHRALKRFSVLVVHRRAGKTVLAVLTLIDAALRDSSKSDRRYGYIAPELKQAKGVSWDFLKRYALPIPGTKVNESELFVEFPNGSRIRLYGADLPDRLRGIYLDGVVLDEVAQMKPEVWGEVIRPALADRHGWALFIGTPKGVNLFSELYFSALRDPEWYAGLFPYEDTGALTTAEIEGMRAGPNCLTDAQFRQEMLCDFAAGAENQLMSLELVNTAMGKHLDAATYMYAPKILGVDVARQGDDRTAIFRRQGLASFSPIILKGADAMAVSGRVAGEIAEWDPDAVMVDGSGGYGAGVIDRLRQLGHTVCEIQFGGKPMDERFADKRSEIWFLMAEWLRSGGALPPLPALRADLCAPTYTHNAAGKLSLERKEDMKARGMPSPDLGDALACSFAFPVAPRVTVGGQHMAGSARVVFDYDPFAEDR